MSHTIVSSTLHPSSIAFPCYSSREHAPTPANHRLMAVGLNKVKRRVHQKPAAEHSFICKKPAITACGIEAISKEFNAYINKFGTKPRAGTKLGIQAREAFDTLPPELQQRVKTLSKSHAATETKARLFMRAVVYSPSARAKSRWCCGLLQNALVIP